MSKNYLCLALGIAVENPQRSEDLKPFDFAQDKLLARPAGERPNNYLKLIEKQNFDLENIFHI
ncbi:MAG: hypothetical protein A3F72_15435 [Bacteroidetes bacterium RIFCSPLOWO2_12_FULL_35_15]|nr:MAG: hypothetical protein A3F72_15435 [Bacteroidetes bacterium RIFCSPLOWO2_12_FULL_35_15]